MNNVEIGLSSWEGAEGLQAITVSATAYFAIQPPESGLGPRTQTLVALHGWGQNGPAFLRKFSALRASNVLVIAPQAPYQFYLDMESRKVGFGWLTSFDRRRGIADGIGLVDGVISAVEQQYGIEISRPFVLGFSQGVSLAFRYGIYGARRVSGVIACGGDLPPDVELKLPECVPFPVKLVHGTQDVVVPPGKSEAAERALRAHDFPLSADYFEGGHEVPEDVVLGLPAWMNQTR